MEKEILHVVESFGGGVYDFIVSLVNELPEFKHTILYGKRENFKKNLEEDFKNNINFILWENAHREINLKKDFLAGKELYKILSKKNYDKIHLHSSKAGFIGRVVGKLKNQTNKIIYTTHGISFLRKDVSKIKNNLFILLEKLGMYLGGEVIACSKSEADFMIEKGIKKTKYIFNGINILDIKDKEKKDEITIVTIGRITEAKNPKLFNKIAKKFIENKNIKFKWIGDGELRKELNSPNIKITGWKEKREVIEEAKEGDIYLSTSLWEGLPLSVLEGMSLKLPVVLSNCVGNIDLVKNNQNGYIFSGCDEGVRAIRNLLGEDLKVKGSESRRIVEKLSVDNMKKEYRKYYLYENKGMENYEISNS